MQQEIQVQGLRLSPHQRRLWGFQQHGEVCHTQAVIRMDGEFDGDRVHHTLRRVVARHHSLRTTFYRELGVKVPFQVIFDQDNILWQCLDLQGLALTRREEVVEAELTNQRAAAVDWERGPLVRAAWCLMSPARSLLLLDIPALCADRRSIQNIVSEMGRWYGARDEDDSTDEPVQYAQFSEWQNELLTEDEAEAGCEWWTKQNLSAYPPLILPFERSPALSCRFSPLRSIRQDVPQDVARRLEQIAREQKSSVAVILHACWQMLLARVMRRQDLICWWRCDGRKYDELQDGIGLFEKWVPVYGQLDGHMSVHDVIVRAGQAHGQAIECQEYFLGATDSGQRNALTDPIGFEYERLEDSCRIEQGLLTLERTLLCTEPFKLRLACSQQHRSLCLAWHYSPERLSGEWVEHLAEQYMTLLGGIPEHITDPIECLSLVGVPERQRLIHTWNNTKRAFNESAPLHLLFERQASRHAAAPALVAGDCALTYGELNAQANQVAHGLIRRGVKQGDCVGLCMERSAGMIIGLLGVLKAGAAYVPIDPAHADVRLAPQMTQSGATILLVGNESSGPWPGFEGTVLTLDPLASDFSAEPDIDPNRQISSDDLAYVIYTSGSTGVPKGVAISHRSAVNYTLALCRQLDLKKPLRFATVSTLSADLGNTVIFTSLVSGGCLHVISYEIATDGRLFGAYMGCHAVDVLKIVPSHFKALLATATGGPVFPSRYLILGGEPLSRELAETVAQLGKCIVLNHYGPTETTIGALTHRCSEESDSTLSQSVPIGRPLDNLEAFILDRRLELLPVGVPGELYLGGVGLARGYLGLPDRTAERFLPHPYSTESGTRLYRTGDMARYLPSGAIEFLGRLDHQVKIRGFRIELGEIETILAQHSDVQDAVVTVRESEQGEPYLAAYLVVRETLSDGQLIQEFLRTRLPDYMIPTRVTYLPALPLTANGKVDRKALPEPNPDGMGRAEFVAPRTATEEILAGLWSEVLKRDTPGIHDNFFDLGGHSLLATQVMSRLRQAFHINVPLRTLFESPSIAQLAEVVDAARTRGVDASRPPVVPVSRIGPIPVSFAQQRLWVLAQLDPDSPAYNIPIALQIKGQLDVPALEGSFNEIVRRHEVLRTTFTTVNGGLIQIMAPSLTVICPLIDLQHIPERDRERAAIRLAGSEAQRPFDLRYGPLLRVSLLRLHPDEHILLLTLHHIVSDAWSAHILIREVTILYDAFLKGRSSPLSDLPLQYADFSQWQHGWLSGSILESELRYWKTVLSGELPTLHLPTDRPRPLIQSSRGGIESLVLSVDVSTAAKELSRRTSATIYMTLLTAWYLLLFRYSGQGDLIIGTPIANRTSREVEDLIGFFVNTLAIRIHVRGCSTVSDMIEQVREACLGAYSHQDVPFEKLVEVLHPRRDIGRAPIFQVMFDLQNAPFSELDVQGLEFTSLEIESQTAKFDLSMTVQEWDQQFVVSIEYSSDLFNASTIRRMLEHYERLLSGMAVGPERQVIGVPLLSPEDRQQILALNRANEPTPRVRCVHEEFERQVERTPDASAVIWDEHELSYRELNAKSNQLARFLRERGVGPEKRVGICMDRSLDMAVTVLAIMKAGGAYVPIDPNYPSQRRTSLARDAGIHILVTHEVRMAEDNELSDNLLCLDVAQAEIDACSPDNLVSLPALLNAAYVIYTSGSTGKPKGVVISHQALSLHAAAAARRFGIQSSDRVLQFAALSFDVAAEELFSTWLSGATVILQPCRLFDSIQTFLDFLVRQRISVVGLPASYWQQWVGQLDGAFVEVPPDLRVLIVGNEAVSAADLGLWVQQVGTRVRWLNAYGPTEATVTATVYEPDLEQPIVASGIVPIGRPLLNRSVYILDSTLKPVPIGMSGELYLGGETLARGYLHQPALTAEMFMPDDFSDIPGSRLYKTGDCARVNSDGTIEFLGRIDDQIKLRGFRIELGEIEATLCRHPNVQEAAIVALEDDKAVTRLVAYIVVCGDVSPDLGWLRLWLGESLPDYMVPSLIVSLSRLPRTAGGKIDRAVLPDPEWSGESGDGYVEPSTPMEIRLAALWSELLGVGTVGSHDNFFDLGGHSLLAVQLISGLQKIIDRPLSLMDLFHAPTVAGLAGLIENEEARTSSGIVVLRAGSIHSPLYCFDPTGTHVQAYRPLALSLPVEQPVYGLSLNHIFSMKWQEMSLAAIASQQARLIVNRQPTGPYRLLGWSNGGVMAFATAQVLEQQGKSVDFLGVLDTQPDLAVYGVKDATPIDELMAYIRRDREEAFNSISESERNTLQQRLMDLSGDARLEYAIRWAQERDFLSMAEAEASVGVLKLGYALAKEAALFLNASESEPIAAPIHVWWSSATLARVGSAPIDWRRYTKGLVEQYTVLGEHSDVIQSIQVHQTLDEIMNRLNHMA
ncbi:amino acid adenylation domain-containing protein [Nitrospira sp. T9]|uniref:amino acid adenylation domain-containing protein n=1 Tax=unclassified Nitrospira TaxID=2652172 RepID=UPI003F9A7717